MERIYDDLTGLFTFAGFQLRVEEYLQSNEGKYVMIRFDVENFKMVNNMFGFSEGDRLLNQIGETLGQLTKMLPDLMCCRVMGDIFCAFVRQEYGQELVDTMLQSHFYVEEDETRPIEINIGIYQITDNDMPVSLMCDRASMALSTIKGNRMERVAIYDEHIYQNLVSEHELCLQLGSSLKEGQLKMYLQPQVNVNGVVMGAEALIRWDHPTRGLLAPGEFLPMFERNYMIVQIDQFIWEQACRQLQAWSKTNKKNLYISVNVSPCDFECMNVYDVLTRLVRKYEINPKLLRVEITETTIMQNPYEQIKLIGRLREAGFYVEMDDFGSGYSSFSMLKDIKLDAIKLDMRFLSASMNPERGERGKKIISTIIALSKELNMSVIAEGVETKDDVEYLKRNGCDMFQGFYYARPMKLEDFEEMANKSSSFFQRKAVC